MLLVSCFLSLVVLFSLVVTVVFSITSIINLPIRFYYACKKLLRGCRKVLVSKISEDCVGRIPVKSRS